MSHNISEMMHAGHPQKQSIAAAYAMKRRSAKKMAKGGMFPDDGEAGSKVHPDSVSEQEAAIHALEKLRMGQAEAKQAQSQIKCPTKVNYDDGGEVENEGIIDTAGASGASGAEDPRVQQRMNERQKMQQANVLPQTQTEEANPMDAATAKRRAERQQEDEKLHSELGYADGGMIDTMNEKLHPYHQPMHERSLVQRMMRQRGVDPNTAMLAHGGEIEDSDLNNATPEEAWIHDNANFEVEESEEERKSRMHEGMRRMLKY
jgi:hypothetical protein